FLAQDLEEADRLLGERVDRAEQRRLLVQRLALPAAERGGNDESLSVRMFEDERGARGVPRGVAARFERRAEAARGEARGIGLALDEELAGELVDRGAVRGVVD